MSQNQIDQSNFKETEAKHVYMDTVTGKFFFCDETTEAHGPFESIGEANNAMDTYVANLNHGAEVADGLAALLGGGNIADILQQLQQSKWPLISAAEKEAKVNELLEVVLADVKLGFEMNPEDFETDFDALQFFAAQVGAATLMQAHAADCLAVSLTKHSYSVRTVDECHEVLREFYIDQCFFPDTKVADHFRFSEEAERHVKATTIKAYQEIALHNKMPTSADEINPVQKEAALKIGALMQKLTKDIVKEQGANTAVYVIEYVDRIRFDMLTMMPPAERHEQLQKGFMSSIDDPMDALKWLTNHLSRLCIIRDTSVPDGPEQPWNWSESGELEAQAILARNK